MKRVAFFYYFLLIMFRKRVGRVVCLYKKRDLFRFIIFLMYPLGHSCRISVYMEVALIDSP